MFARCRVKSLKTGVQIFELSLHGENLLVRRGNGRLGIGDAESPEDPIRPGRAPADRALCLALAERRVHYTDGVERLQGLLGGQVQVSRSQLALQGTHQQQGQGGDEEMSFHPGIGLVVNRAHLQDVLELSEAPLHVAEILVDLYSLDRRQIGLFGLDQVFAFISLLLGQVDRVLEIAEGAFTVFPGVVTLTVVSGQNPSRCGSDFFRSLDLPLLDAAT